MLKVMFPEVVGNVQFCLLRRATGRDAAWAAGGERRVKEAEAEAAIGQLEPEFRPVGQDFVKPAGG